MKMSIYHCTSSTRGCAELLKNADSSAAAAGGRAGSPSAGFFFKKQVVHLYVLIIK